MQMKEDASNLAHPLLSLFLSTVTRPFKRRMFSSSILCVISDALLLL